MPAISASLMRHGRQYMPKLEISDRFALRNLAQNVKQRAPQWFGQQCAGLSTAMI